MDALMKHIYDLISRHEGMAGLLAIAFILHLPAPQDLPKLARLGPREIVAWLGDWARCAYGWTRDSLQAYVNRPAKKE